MAVGFSDTDYKQDIPVNLGIRGRPQPCEGANKNMLEYLLK